MGAPEYEYGAIAPGDPTASPAAAREAGLARVIGSRGVTQDEIRGLVSSALGQGNVVPEGHGSPFAKGSRRTDNGRWVTIFLILNYMIGSGILNTPQTCRDSGVAAATVLYVIACAAVYLGAVSLILAAEASSPGGKGTLEELEFSALAKRTLGYHGGWVVDVSIVVQNFGATCSYVVLVGSLTTSMIAEGAGLDAPAHWWQSFYFVTPLMVLLLVLPPCLVRHFSNLRWLSALSLVAVSAVVCLVVLGGPKFADAERMSSVGEELAELAAPILWWSWTASFAKFGSVVFALTCAPAGLHSYSAMGQRNIGEWKAVMKWAVYIGGILCYGTGIFGYLSFREATEGDILDNFSGIMAAFFKILVVLHLVMYIPNEVVILRHSLFDLMSTNVLEADFRLLATVTVGALTLITGVVTGLMLAGIAQGELFGYILDLTGGITASLTSFVLPAMTYLAATRDRKSDDPTARWYRMGCHLLKWFGISVMVVVPTAVLLTAFGQA